MCWDPKFPHETQAQLVDRRRAEAEATYQEHRAAIEVHRAAGTLIRLPYRGDDPDYQRRRAKW